MCATPAPVVGYIVPAPTVFSVASAPGENPSASGYVIAATPAVSSVGPAPPRMLRAKRRWLCCLFQTMAVGVFRCCSPTSHCCVSASQHLRSLGRFSRHEKLGERSRFPHLLLQRANSAPAQCRAGRRIPIASSRCHQRQRRACDLRPRSSLKRSFWGGLKWSSNFDTSCAERQIPGCARLFAPQAAGLGCRANPLEFESGQARPIPGLRFHSLLCFEASPRSASTDLLSAHNWVFRLGS